jgi:SAM-dependent methyltransferase
MVDSRHHWDSMYRDHGADLPWETPTVPPEIRYWNRLVPAAAAVLDLGCGRGACAFAIAEGGHRVVGVDLSVNAIVAARRRAAERGVESVMFKVGDVRTFRSITRFALVYDYSVLHHIADHDLSAYVATVDAALHPGGYYALVCYSELDVCCRGQRRREGDYGNLIYHRSRQEVSDLFGSGMTAIEYQETAVGRGGKHRGHHFVFWKHC